MHLNHGEGEKGEQRNVFGKHNISTSRPRPPNLFSPSIFSLLFLDEDSIRIIFTRRLISHAF